MSYFLFSLYLLTIIQCSNSTGNVIIVPRSYEANSRLINRKKKSIINKRSGRSVLNHRKGLSLKRTFIKTGSKILRTGTEGKFLTFVDALIARLICNDDICILIFLSPNFGPGASFRGHINSIICHFWHGNSQFL